MRNKLKNPVTQKWIRVGNKKKLKNIKKTNLKIISLVLILVCVSCKKEKSHDDVIIEKSNPNYSIAYVYPSNDELIYDSTLMALQWGLVNLSKNAVFRDSIHQWCSGMFDGDYNVLTKVISERWPSFQDSLLASIIINAPPPLNIDLIKYVSFAATNFTYFDEQAYPQIYVPEFETVTKNTNPMICLNLNDDILLPGIRLVGGIIQQYPGVSESYVLANNLGWVVSCNETINTPSDYENLDQFYFNDLSGSLTNSADSNVIGSGDAYAVKKNQEGSSNNIYRAPHSVGVRLLQVKLSDRKEAWGNGRGEVSFLAYQWNNNCVSTMGAYLDDRAKLSKNNVNKWIDLKSSTSKHNTIAGGSSGATVSPYNIDKNLWSLCYERDKRSKFQRSVIPPSFGPYVFNSCPLNKLYYTAKEPAWGDIQYHWTWWDSHYNSMGSREINCNMNGGTNWNKFVVYR